MSEQADFLHQLVFRWAGNQQQHGTGITAVARSCDAERADALSRDLLPLLRVEGGTRPGLVRVILEATGDVVLIRREVGKDAHGRRSTLSHALVAGSDVLRPQLCLSLIDWDWAWAALPESPSGQIDPMERWRLTDAAGTAMELGDENAGQVGVTPGSWYARNVDQVAEALTVLAAQLLRAPWGRVSVRASGLPTWPTGNYAPMVIWGLCGIFGDWFGPDYWSFATYATGDTYPLRITFVPEWRHSAVQDPGLTRVDLHHAVEDDAHRIAAELVRRFLSAPMEPLGGLLHEVRLTPGDMSGRHLGALAQVLSGPPRRPGFSRPEHREVTRTPSGGRPWAPSRRGRGGTLDEAGSGGRPGAPGPEHAGAAPAAGAVHDPPSGSGRMDGQGWSGAGGQPGRGPLPDPGPPQAPEGRSGPDGYPGPGHGGPGGHLGGGGHPGAGGLPGAGDALDGAGYHGPGGGGGAAGSAPGPGDEQPPEAYPPQGSAPGAAEIRDARPVPAPPPQRQSGGDPGYGAEPDRDPRSGPGHTGAALPPAAAAPPAPREGKLGGPDDVFDQDPRPANREPAAHHGVRQAGGTPGGRRPSAPGRQPGAYDASQGTGALPGTGTPQGPPGQDQLGQGYAGRQGQARQGYGSPPPARQGHGQQGQDWQGHGQQGRGRQQAGAPPQGSYATGGDRSPHPPASSGYGQPPPPQGQPGFEQPPQGGRGPGGPQPQAQPQAQAQYPSLPPLPDATGRVRRTLARLARSFPGRGDLEGTAVESAVDDARVAQGAEHRVRARRRLAQVSDSALLREIDRPGNARVLVDLVLFALADRSRHRSRRDAEALCEAVLGTYLYLEHGRSSAAAGKDVLCGEAVHVADVAVWLFSWAVRPYVRRPGVEGALGGFLMAVGDDPHLLELRILERAVIGPEDGLVPDLPKEIWAQILRARLGRPAGTGGQRRPGGGDGAGGGDGGAHEEDGDGGAPGGGPDGGGGQGGGGRGHGSGHGAGAAGSGGEQISQGGQAGGGGTGSGGGHGDSRCPGRRQPTGGESRGPSSGRRRRWMVLGLVATAGGGVSALVSSCLFG